MKTNLVISMLSTLLLGMGCLAGCNDPRAAAASEARIARINNYGRRFVERENDGARRLAVMGQRIDRDIQWHDELLRRDLKNVRLWTERDFQRWQERQPYYQSQIQDQLDGNLELAEQIFPRMVY